MDASTRENIERIATNAAEALYGEGSGMDQIIHDGLTKNTTETIGSVVKMLNNVADEFDANGIAPTTDHFRALARGLAAAFPATEPSEIG